jgi:hypothetical protein
LSSTGRICLQGTFAEALKRVQDPPLQCRIPSTKLRVHAEDRPTQHRTLRQSQHGMVRTRNNVNMICQRPKHLGFCANSVGPEVHIQLAFLPTTSGGWGAAALGFQPGYSATSWARTIVRRASSKPGPTFVCGAGWNGSPPPSHQSHSAKLRIL